jgi:outer membrane protein OmpA-like peptidoglycan-associated protein
LASTYSRWSARFAVATAALATLLTTRSASAQQHTFKLDRLEIPGAPEDGLVLFRPVTQPKPIFFAQLGLGYSLHPLHTSNIVSATDKSTLRASDSSVVSDQLTTYGTVGFQFLNRITVGVTLPVTVVEEGKNPNYATGPFGGAKTTTVDANGAAVNDMRLDIRAVLFRTKDEKGALGAGLSVFTPTGSVANFGGDGAVGSLLMLAGEYDFKWFIVTANTGVHFRPKNSINNPVAANGLGIGNEWRWAAGAFIPLKGGKFRVGGTIFGQTGIESDTNIIGDTAFTKRNSPIEWNVEGRMKFGAKDRWWLGAGGGTLIGNGYGAPDFRFVALVGTYFPISDSDASSPDRKAALREKWHSERTGDADNDGIPDDIDACPSDPEDHLGSDPNDGCPMPPDKDGDGIPDQYDKCPDQPEDKDGIDDGDGCPEDDADKDGVPDTTDACPHEPGQPSPNPKQNGCPQFIKMEGGVVRILQQVHFATGSDVILPESFPMLQEIANLLKANVAIKKMSIEGHTDNRGAEDLNTRLSAGRANSVLRWLTSHGVAEPRLESHGFGPTKPIEENTTDKGRAANRRVEFKIVEEADTNKVESK